MKYLKVEVTRTESTELYIEVPDEFDGATIMHQSFQERIGKIAMETTDSMDWDNYGWEENIEVQSVKTVSKDEAEQYMVGTLVDRGAP